MITEIITLGTDDADVLGTADSILETAPEDGRYEFWFASDQVDGLLSILVGGEVVAEEMNAKVQVVSQVDMSQAPVVSVFVDGGARVIANYNEVTAGTAILVARFSDTMDLLAEGVDLSALAE